MKENCDLETNRLLLLEVRYPCSALVEFWKIKVMSGLFAGIYGFARYYKMPCDVEETIEQMLGGPRSFDEILEEYHKIDFS